MDGISTGGESTQQAISVAMIKKTLDFEQAMTTQLINGSLQGDAAAQIRTSALQDMGRGQNINTTA